MAGPFPLPAGRVAAASEINDAFYRILEHFASVNLVATDQSLAGTTYADLATAGPALTVTSVGTKAFVYVGAQMYSSVAVGSCLMSFAISGATTLAASDDNAAAQTGQAGTAFAVKYGDWSMITITPGANTYTAKYRADTTGTAHFVRRKLIVFAP